MRSLLVLPLLGMLAAACPKPESAHAGIPVSILVTDAFGEPVPTAVVRNPEEKDRHRVSTVTGLWTADRLYLSGGTVLPFERGMPLVFEVTAPGYVTVTVSHVVRRRENLIAVVLSEMSLDTEEDADPQIRFGRDTPLDGVPIAPPVPPDS